MSSLPHPRPAVHPHPPTPTHTHPEADLAFLEDTALDLRDDRPIDVLRLARPNLDSHPEPVTVPGLPESEDRPPVVPRAVVYPRLELHPRYNFDGVFAFDRALLSTAELELWSLDGPLPVRIGRVGAMGDLLAAAAGFGARRFAVRVAK